MRRLLIIPAAGLGSRLGATRPKPLVEVNGRPMLDHLMALYRPFVDDTVVIANPSFVSSVVEWGRHANAPLSITEQPSPTGMLDAILLAGPFVSRSRPDEVWITWSDQVGVLPATAERMADVMTTAPKPALALPTVRRSQPYIHFDRDDSGRIARLRQRREGDVMPDQGEGDIGLFAMARATFEDDLEAYARDVPRGHATGERNFVPFVPWLAQRKAVATFPCTDPMEAVGINTPDELRQVEAWLRGRA